MNCKKIVFPAYKKSNLPGAGESKIHYARFIIVRLTEIYTYICHQH